MDNSNSRFDIDDLPPDMNHEDIVKAHMDAAGLEMPWTSEQLDSATIKVHYLIDWVLVANQPAVIAGVFKSWKTSLAIELALSMAHAVPFLNHFECREPQRVLLFSAESGQATIQETARRVCRSMTSRLDEDRDPIRLRDSSVHWGWWVPKASVDAQLTAIKMLIDLYGAEVVIIDPLYLSLTGEIQANLSLSGEQLHALTQACLERGATPVCVDHVKRGSGNAKDYQPLELWDIAGAGKAEFFRQWILIGRREKYDPEIPVSKLWATIGGSAGHSGQYAIDIDESRDDDGQRLWGIDISKASEARVNDQAERERTKAAAQEKRDEQRLDASVRKIRAAFNTDEPWSSNKIRMATGVKPQPLADALAYLVSRDELEICRHKRPTGPEHDAFRWTKNALHRKG